MMLGDRKCGRTLPDTIKTPTGHSRIVFKSNQAANGDGFTIHWHLDCGGVFDTESGHFSSPGYPIQYDNDLNCNYTINTQDQHFIVATFVETFSLESHCDYDRVEITEMASNSSRGTYCGDEKPPTISTRGGMIVNFITDHSVQKKGFKLEWATHQCGGITDEEGEIR